MKIILKLNIVKIVDGEVKGDTIHIPIGEKLLLKDNECITSIEFNDVKLIYTAKDCE